MANFVLKDASIVVNSVDLSDHCKSVTLDYEAEMVDETMMGDGTRGNKAGLLNWSMEAEFESDFASGEVDATLFPLIGADAFPVVLKATSAAVSASNPSFSGDAVLENYTPIGGTVGDLSMTSCSFRCASPLIRATS
jgi:hypothetical protein